MDANILNRIQGCAVGAAAGDALGMPLEFGPAVPADRLVREMQPGRLPAGSFTDDTEMALALAESLIACGQMDNTDAARRFVDWMKSWPPDIGGQTLRALRWIDEGMNWQDAARQMLDRYPNSAGNGSLMRCWPAAIFAWRDMDQLAAASRLQSQITHPQALCTEACVFANILTARLIAGDGIPAAYEYALKNVELPPILREAVLRAPQTDREHLPNSGYVRDTLESALWGLLTTGSFEECVVQVANLGNDADTAASAAGAMAGAAYGLDGIPERWKNQLRGEWPPHSRSILRMEDILRLAERLAEAA